MVVRNIQSVNGRGGKSRKMMYNDILWKKERLEKKIVIW